MSQTSGNTLQRRLGLYPATNIVISNMIGAGIFTTSGLLMADLNNPYLMLSLWVIGGIIALCGAISYGELGANMPDAGGEYLFLSKLFNPLSGFLSGWVSFLVGFSAPIAASAIGFSSYFVRAFPNLPSWIEQNSWIPGSATEKILAVSVIVLFSAIHYRGLKLGAGIQNFLTILKIGLVVGLIFLGLLSGKGDVSHFSQGSFDFSGFQAWKTIGLSLLWIMFAYSGWNASTYIGSEIKNPLRNLPGSLLLGTLIVMILYLLINVVFIYAIPPAEMSGVIAVGGLAMENMFGLTGGAISSLLISFALFSSLSAFLIIGPRVYYSMAKDGLFFKAAAKIHPRFNVPSISIVFQCAISLILTITGTFEQILTFMGFSLGIFPLLAIAGLFKIRIKGKSSLKLPGYPIAQIIFLLSGLLMLVLAYFERPFESTMGIITVLTGIPAYYLFKGTFYKVSKNRKKDGASQGI
jgi:basic amino acid/polyamine antiporter, APA family